MIDNFDIASALMKPFEDKLKRMSDEQAEMMVWNQCAEMGKALFTPYVICKRMELRHDMTNHRRVIAILNRLEKLGRIEHAENVNSGDSIVKLYRVVSCDG